MHHSYSSTTIQSSSVDLEDCGCGEPTQYSGKPSDNARSNIKHRAAISQLPLYKVNSSGSTTTMEDILDINKKGTSLVVFVRSLG